MTRWWGVVLAATLAGCGRSTGPSDVSLTGQWRGTVGALGIGFITLDLTDTGSEVAGTGTWTPEVGTGSSTLTVTGIQIGTQVQLNLGFVTATGTENEILPGQITGANAFYLVFPSDPPKRVTFTR